MRRAIAVLAGLLLSGSAIAQTTPNWALHYVPPPAEWNGLWASKQDYNAPGKFTTLATVGNATITGNLTVTGTINGGGGSFLPIVGGTLTGPVTSTAAGLAMTINNNFKVNGTGTIGTLVTTAGATIGASLTATNNIFAQGGILILGTAAGGGGSIVSATTGSAGLSFKVSGPGGFNWQDSSANSLMTLTPGTGLQIPTPIRSSSTYLATGVGGLYTMSGSGAAALLGVGTNFTGSYSGTDGIVSIANSTDDVAMTGSSGFTGASLVITRQFGGTNFQGGRTGAYISLIQTTPIVNKPPAGFIAIAPHVAILASAGGTSLIGGNTGGLAYAMYPQAVLHQGATNFTIVSVGEGDVGIQPSSQAFDITGVIAAGDTFSLVVTSADVPGSPVTLTVTAGTGDSAASIVNKLMAAFRTPGLNAAGIAGMQTSIQQLTVASQVQKAPVTAVLTTSGAAVITSGSVIPGASAQQRRGFTINRSGDDGSQGDFTDVGFEIGAGAKASPASGFAAGISFRAEGMSPVSTLIRAVNQIGFSATAVSGPFHRLQAKYGIDFSLMNFTQSGGVAIKVPGATLGAGILGLQNGFISMTGAGMTLDVPGGLIGTGNPIIVSGGVGTAGQDQFRYFNGDTIQDGNGGQYVVDGVDNSTGNVTHLTTLVQPSTSTGSLGVGIATTGGSSLGLTITPTAAAANNKLVLMPSGGATTIGGSLAVTGTLTGPTTTQAVDTNTTALASTAFVLGQASAATPLIDGTATVGTSTRYARADHVHPTDTTRAALSGATFTGAVNIGNNTTTQALAINGPAGIGRILLWQTAGSKRWQWNANATAEGGSNAGTDLVLTSFDDSGVLLTTPLTITRSTGTVAFGTLVRFNGSSVVANGAIATTMTSVGPTGSHTTIQEWLSVQNASGTTRYIPLY